MVSYSVEVGVAIGGPPQPTQGGMPAPLQPGEIKQSPYDLKFYVSVFDGEPAAGVLKWTACAIVAPPKPIKKYK